MAPTSLTAPARRRILVAILVAGLAASAAIYWRATSPTANPLGYDPADTKSYLRQMEVYGGTANELATELRLWFASLWHGERLAFTVAFLTLVSAWAYWFFSRPPLDDEAGEDVRTPRGP
jgi:hypothetical protein